MRLKAGGAGLALGLIGALLAPTPAVADDENGSTLQSDNWSVRVKAWQQRQDKPVTTTSPAKTRNPSPQAESRYTYLPKDQYKSQMSEYRQRLAAAIAVNDAARNAQGQCIDNGAELACNRFEQNALPDVPDIRQAGDPADPAAPAPPALSPQEVAYIATARLQLTPPKPVIGPSPESNEWKMAAVGYPLWLWADGDADPAPVGDSVADIAVSLDAELVKVVFDMGDGHKVTCSDLSTRWTAAVPPGTKSPSCGYAYEKPSLPAGSYTITANAVWAIDWNINGTTGTIPLYQSATTEIPVGELQVLVR